MGVGCFVIHYGCDLPDEQFQMLRNLPSRVFYGVNSDAAITLRLLGVPRTAATGLASSMHDVLNQPLGNLRTRLRSMDETSWNQALGQREGGVYQKIWRVLEGLD